MNGYNAAIICFGQTGMGKTYTINEIIPQVITQIFENINETDSNTYMKHTRKHKKSTYPIC